MRRDATPPSLDDQAYLQAAEWIELLGDRPLDTLTRKRLQNWLKANPAHRPLLQRMVASCGDPVLMDALKHYDRRRALPFFGFPLLRRGLWLGVSASLLVVSLLFGKGIFQAYGPMLQRDVRQVYVSDYQTQQHQLADGSQITQSAASEVIVELSEGARHISLRRGAAFFDVASDRQRPFKVSIQEVSVTAVGTQFAIDKTRRGVELTIYEGAVELRAQVGASPQLLRSGEKTHIVHGRVSAVEQVDIEKLVDWRSGWIEINGEPLSHLLEQVNRYSRQKVRVQSPSLNAIPVSGRFQLADAAATVEAVSQFYSLHVTAQGDDFLLSKRRGLPGTN